MDFMYLLISKPVKWRAEMCQLQAVRPRRGQPAYNFQLSTNATSTAIKTRSEASTRRAVANGGNHRPAGLREAGRPHFVVS